MAELTWFNSNRKPERSVARSNPKWRLTTISGFIQNIDNPNNVLVQIGGGKWRGATKAEKNRLGGF